MIMTRELKFGCAMFAAALLSPLAVGEDQAAGKALVEGSVGKIKWGEYWAGPKLRGAKSLEGKVVLLKIWGG